MKYELPCEVVKDLLPSYIDELTGDSTKEFVKAHLAGCAECKKMYEDMKEEVKKPKSDAKTDEVEGEKKLYKKIKCQIHKKVWIAISAGLAAVLLAIGIEHLLYGAIIKDVPLEDIHISTTVYTMEEYKQLNLEDNSILEPITDSDEYRDDLGYAVADIDDVKYLTTIEITSPYIIQKVGFWDFARRSHNGVLQIDCVETTILNNRLSQGESSFSYTCYGEVDKIVYSEVGGDEEVVLWESGQE